MRYRGATWYKNCSFKKLSIKTAAVIFLHELLSDFGSQFIVHDHACGPVRVHWFPASTRNHVPYSRNSLLLMRSICFHFVDGLQVIK